MTDVPPPRGPSGSNLDPRYSGERPLLGALYSAHPRPEDIKAPAAAPAAPEAPEPSVRTAASAAPLSPGQRINVSLTPLSGGGFVLVAPQGTFLVGADFPVPKSLQSPGATATLTIVRDGPVVAGELVPNAPGAAKVPTPVDLTRVQPGAQFQGSVAGADPFGRLVFSTPVGAFALTQADLARLQPPPSQVTVSLTQVGSDIRANILGADGRILENPIPVALARTPLGVAVEATVAGTDKSGRTILSTPFGVFLVNTGGAGAPSLGQLIGQAPDAAARDIAHAVVLATSAGTLGSPTGPVLTNVPTGQAAPNPGREPDRVTFVLTALGAQLTATITGRDGLPLDHPTTVALALAEGEAQVPSARGLARLVPSLGPDQARAIMENLGTVWPALTKALESLNQISPDLMARIIERLPRAGPKLPAQLLAALSAIQSGEPSHLLTSGALDALRKAGQGGLVDDLARDLNRMNALAQQSNPDWRPVLLPFFDGQHLQQIALMIGRPPEHGAGDGDPGTRFVVGIDFAHLGAVQLDGFVEPGQRRFDLTIRSHQALDDEIKTGARSRFQSALDASRFAGRLFFQIGAPFPVAMPEGLGKPTVGLPPSWLRP